MTVFLRLAVRTPPMMPLLSKRIGILEHQAFGLCTEAVNYLNEGRVQHGEYHKGALPNVLQ